MARPRLYDDSLRRDLINEASRTISTAGAPGLSLRSLATSCQTTTAAIYSLFGNKEALVTAVLAEGFSRFHAHLAKVPRTDDPAADLLALGLAYRTSALQDPHFYRVMFGGMHDQDKPPAAMDTFNALEAAVARLVPAEYAKIGAIRLWALSHGLVSLELGGLVLGTADQLQDLYASTLRDIGRSLFTPPQPPE